MKNGNELLPAPPDCPSRVDALKRFWIDLGMSGDAGCATWEVLDRLRDRVTMVLMYDPPDVLQAESITAEAMMRISGQSNE